MAEYIQSVRREVMRRVYVVFFLRKVVKPFLIKAGSAAAIIFAATAFVSVQNVLGNMPSPAQFVAFGKFALAAFLNTRFIVQVFSLALAILVVYAVRDLARISRLFTARRFVSIS